MPEAYGMPGTPYAPRNITKDAEVVFPQLPGSENLDEKAMPLSKLVDHQPFPSLGQNSVEKSWIPSELPGTKNLAEKRIPEPVLQKLFQLQEVDQRDP
ncbi:hypothetical protein WN48_05286 [Eufriesea mexicana]|uniref:Uncharacterized protein n=2 Tax=Eufriesea mexicana TaxID=516756 RepID=A0A310SKK2_9HYME|nr:hypothetical protein WN48_05286 [Eufriesea mexicana]